jgi:hypothetical protein
MKKPNLPDELLARIGADIVLKVCNKKMYQVQEVVMDWEFAKFSSLTAIKKIRKIVKEEKQDE